MKKKIGIVKIKVSSGNKGAEITYGSPHWSINFRTVNRWFTHFCVIRNTIKRDGQVQ